MAATKKKKKAARRAPAKKAVRRAKPAKTPGTTGKGAALAAVLQKKHAKTFGSRITTVAEEQHGLAQIKEFIPTGIDALDNYVIGRGGFPVGRMSEVFGAESSGKTALLYRCLGAVQQIGGVAVLLDAEHSFDEERAETHGIEISDLVIGQPAHLEEAIEMLKAALRSHDPQRGPLLLGLDSIASLNTKAGLALDAGEKGVAAEARVLSDELRDMPRLLQEHRAHLFMVNQIRHMIGGSKFASNITTPGGNGPRFYSSVRLQFFGGKAIKNADDEHVGKVVTIMAVKNRLTAPFHKARVRFDYATGYNNQWTTIEHAKRLKLVAAKDKPTYVDALEALDWDFNVVGSIGREVGADDATEADSDDD